MPHYHVKTNAASHFVQADNRLLGAFGTDFQRSWVYQLYTPSGRTVVENFPFDHPFHNGVFVGQNPVRAGDREGNFWAFPVKRSHDDHIMRGMGRMDPESAPVTEVTEAGVRFVLRSSWRDEHEQPLRRTCRMVFRTSRRGTVEGRPPDLSAGIRGRTRSHRASVRSLGYVVRPPGDDRLGFDGGCIVAASQSARLWWLAVDVHRAHCST